jgi:NADH-quinone oxidoreductase subunit C
MIPAGLDEIATAFPTAQFADSLGDAVARVDRDEVVGFLEAVRDAGFVMFVDLCAVDYLTRNPRFEVVVNVVDPDAPQRLRVLVGIPADDPAMPSLVGVYPGSNFYEREAWDLFGVSFGGHPDLSRILLPDEWEGHPLRKDRSVGSVPVQFKEANRVR